jgi:hypothetical protein
MRNTYLLSPEATWITGQTTSGDVDGSLLFNGFGEGHTSLITRLSKSSTPSSIAHFCI